MSWSSSLQLADGLGLSGSGVAELAQAGFQRLENAVEEALLVRIDETAEGRERIAHMGDIDVALWVDPSGKQVLVADEVAEGALDVVHRLGVFFR